MDYSINIYRTKVQELLHSLQYMSEYDYTALLEGAASWETREHIAELKDIAEGNSEY